MSLEPLMNGNMTRASERVMSRHPSSGRYVSAHKSVWSLFWYERVSGTQYVMGHLLVPNMIPCSGAKSENRCPPISLASGHVPTRYDSGTMDSQHHEGIRTHPCW